MLASNSFLRLKALQPRNEKSARSQTNWRRAESVDSGSVSRQAGNWLGLEYASKAASSPEAYRRDSCRGFVQAPDSRASRSNEMG